MTLGYKVTKVEIKTGFMMASDLLQTPTTLPECKCLMCYWMESS